MYASKGDGFSRFHPGFALYSVLSLVQLSSIGICLSEIPQDSPIGVFCLFGPTQGFQIDLFAEKEEPVILD